METLQISRKNAIQAFKGADAPLKKMLQSLFPEIIFSENVKESINDFNDILALSGKPAKDYELRPGETKDELAHRKAKLISLVYNEGVVMDARNTKQRKYFPWALIDEKSGFGLSRYAVDGWIRVRMSAFAFASLKKKMQGMPLRNSPMCTPIFLSTNSFIT